MAGDPGQIPPTLSPRRGAWAALRGPLGLALGLGVVGVLVWRIAVFAVGLGSPPAKPKPEKPQTAGKSRPAAFYQFGQSTDGEIRIYDDKTGRLVVALRFKKSSLKGDAFVLEGVELKRVLDEGKGVLLASALHGVYDRATGSGNLSGKVLVQRTPSGASAPDLLLSSESLAWDHAAGVLTSPDPTTMTWIDPASGRRLVIAGTDLRAERWAETVRLAREVSVSMAESALPSLPLGGKAAGGDRAKAEKAARAPAVTTITCAGPATFENRTELGCRRAVFQREVQATRREVESARQDTQLFCNRLEVLLNPDRGGADRNGADIGAVTQASAGPSAAALAARALGTALTFPPPPKPAGTAERKGPPEQDLVDSVLATGAVVIKGPDGTARGELAYFDQPGGCAWLDGGPREPAEVMRGDDQLVSQSFHFNLRTEEMTSEGRGRATVTHKGDVKLPGKP